MIMWLPKEERKLLKRYYNESKNTRETFEIGFPEVMKILGFNENKASAPATNEMFDIALNANAILKDRELIYFEHEQEDLSKFKISLTLKGYDLGRKYISWWTRSGLWFAEYKNHWIWLIVSFLGGIIGGLLINWLSIGN